MADSRCGSTKPVAITLQLNTILISLKRACPLSSVFISMPELVLQVLPNEVGYLTLGEEELTR